MAEIQIKILDYRIDLVYSPDDGGWYLQEYDMDGTGNDRISIIYRTRGEAIEAYCQDKIEW